MVKIDGINPVYPVGFSTNMEQSMSPSERVNQQAEALLIMAMLLQDEDGIDYGYPQAVVRRIALLRLTEKRLRTCYDHVPRLLDRLSYLLDEVFATSKRSETRLDSRHGELLTEWTRHRQTEARLRRDFVRLLLTECRTLHAEGIGIQPITGTRIVQDIIDYLESEAHELVSAQTLRYAIRRLTRKYQSIRTILSHPLVTALETQVDEQAQKTILITMKQQGRRAFNEISADHAAFAKWAAERNLPYEKAGDFWVDAVTTMWEKLRQGNFDQRYADSLTRLIAKTAMNRVMQHFRDRNPLTDVLPEQDRTLPGADDLDDEGEAVADVEDQYEDVYQFCALKLGFDFMPYANNQKSILYFGTIVKYRWLVGESERRNVESAMQVELDSLTQQALSELLGLGITQGAVAHRLGGYEKRWYTYTRSALLRLRNQADTPAKKGVVDFFQKITFWAMTKAEETPSGNEPWYDHYARMRRQTVPSTSTSSARPTNGNQAQ